MPRLPRFALLSSLLCCACVRVPRQHDHELAADASLDAEIAFDAGPRMPEAGPPYRGPRGACPPRARAGGRRGRRIAGQNAIRRRRPDRMRTRAPPIRMRRTLARIRTADTWARVKGTARQLLAALAAVEQAPD